MSDNDHDNPAARLEALGHITKETEDANPSHESMEKEQAEQAQISLADASAKQWGMLIFTIGGLAQMIAPELKAVYSEDRCFEWGQQANAVAEKYGWNGPSKMPELALIMSTAGFFVPTYFVMKSKMKVAGEGAGPASWLSKAGIWWRTRKVRAQVMTPGEDKATDGSK